MARSDLKLRIPSATPSPPHADRAGARSPSAAPSRPSRQGGSERDGESPIPGSAGWLLEEAAAAAKVIARTVLLALLLAALCGALGYALDGARGAIIGAALGAFLALVPWGRR